MTLTAGEIVHMLTVEHMTFRDVAKIDGRAPTTFHRHCLAQGIVPRGRRRTAAERRAQIEPMLRAGMTYREIIAATGIAHGTLGWHVRRLNLWRRPAGGRMGFRGIKKPRPIAGGSMTAGCGDIDVSAMDAMPAQEAA